MWYARACTHTWTIESGCNLQMPQTTRSKFAKAHAPQLCAASCDPWQLRNSQHGYLFQTMYHLSNTLRAARRSATGLHFACAVILSFVSRPVAIMQTQSRSRSCAPRFLHYALTSTAARKAHRLRHGSPDSQQSAQQCGAERHHSCSAC